MSKPMYFTGTCTCAASGLRNSANTSTDAGHDLALVVVDLDLLGQLTDLVGDLLLGDEHALHIGVQVVRLLGRGVHRQQRRGHSGRAMRSPGLIGTRACHTDARRPTPRA